MEMETNQEKAIRLRLKNQPRIKALQFAVFCTEPLAIESKDGIGLFKDAADYDQVCEVFRQVKTFCQQNGAVFSRYFLDSPAVQVFEKPKLLIELDDMCSSAEQSTLGFCGDCLYLLGFFSDESDPIKLSCGCSTTILDRLDYDILFCDESYTEADIDRLARLIETEEELQLEFLEALCNPTGDEDFATLSAKFMSRRIWVGQYIVEGRLTGRNWGDGESS